MDTLLIGLIVFVILLFFSTLKVVRPTQRALVERMGRYNRFWDSGIHFRIPIIERVYPINVTERMVDAEPQEIITNDNLNARVDAQVYFRVRSDEQNVKNSVYNVNNYEVQIVNLARTTLRDTIGQMPFKQVNSERSKLNQKLAEELKRETKSWGIDIVRTELKEIDPPKDVQETMNKVLKAENEKIAAVDFATARETEADGVKRAAIKEAEGAAQAIKLKAEAQANAIKVVSESAEKYFQQRAEAQRKLEVLERTLGTGTKWVIPANSSLLNILPLADKGGKHSVISDEIMSGAAEEVMKAGKKGRT